MHVVATAVASGRANGENPSSIDWATENRDAKMRAFKMINVPIRSATLRIEKNSSNVSLFMTRTSLEIGQNRRVTTFKERIKADISEAMKARDELKLSTLRMVLSAIQNAEVAGDEAIVLSDDQATAVLRAEAKKRAESAQIYADAGRADAATKERAECAVIEAYLPAAMSDDDVAKIVTEEVANAAAAGVTGGKAMGAVVKAVRERVGSGADGQKIAALVKSALGS